MSVKCSKLESTDFIEEEEEYSHLECILCIPFSLGLGKKRFPVIIAKHNGIFFFLSLLVSRLYQEHFTDISTAEGYMYEAGDMRRTRSCIFFLFYDIF